MEEEKEAVEETGIDLKKQDVIILDPSLNQDTALVSLKISAAMAMDEMVVVVAAALMVAEGTKAIRAGLET